MATASPQNVITRRAGARPGDPIAGKMGRPDRATPRGRAMTMLRSRTVASCRREGAAFAARRLALQAAHDQRHQRIEAGDEAAAFAADGEREVFRHEALRTVGERPDRVDDGGL